MPEKQILPILVMSNGRSGSTMLMQLLGLDPSCFFPRLDPYEIRYLTYICKIAALWRRCESVGNDYVDTYYHWKLPTLGAAPWGLRGIFPEDIAGFPKEKDVLMQLWNQMLPSIEAQQPGARYYVEKAAYWIVPMLKQVTQYYAIDLFRDPRDVFISRTKWIKAHSNPIAWNLTEDTGDFQHALNMCRGISNHFENYLVRKDVRSTILLKYEDLIVNRREALRKVEDTLEINLEGSIESDMRPEHVTAKSVEASIKRYKHEGMPETVRKCLEANLQEAFNHFGYDDVPEVASPEENGRYYFDRRLINDGFKSDDGRLVLAGDRVTVELKGEHFQFGLPIDAFDAESVAEVWLCAAGIAGSRFSLFWRGENEELSEERAIHLTYYPGEHYDVMCFPVTEHPKWKGKIKELRFGAFNGPGPKVKPNSLFLRWVHLAKAKHCFE